LKRFLVLWICVSSMALKILEIPEFLEDEADFYPLIGRPFAWKLTRRLMNLLRSRCIAFEGYPRSEFPQTQLKRRLIESCRD